MSLTLVTAPSVYPITEAQAWAWLRVPLLGSPAVPADQTLISDLIAGVTAKLDGVRGAFGRAIVQQTWDLKLDSFPGGRNSQTGYRGAGAATNRIDVPLPPLRSVTSISYVDTNGDTQTLDSSIYTVDTSEEPGRITPAYQQSWPITRDVINAVTIRFVAGYAPSTDSPADYRANVPKNMLIGIRKMICDNYDFRGSRQGTPVYEISDGAWEFLSEFQINGGFE